LNKIRLRILNNPAQRFRPPPLRFSGQKSISPRPPFLFAHLSRNQTGGLYYGGARATKRNSLDIFALLFLKN
jgi:hypothetical protein